MAPKRRTTRKTKTQTISEVSKNDNDNNIDALINEIGLMKKAITEKETIINDLALERDRIKTDKDALNVKYERTQQQLAESNKKVKELENERTLLKKEIEGLNDDVINSTVSIDSQSNNSLGSETENKSKSWKKT